MRELFEIQQRLKSPKNEYNEFGKFNYRSLETILSSVKPLLNELECTVTFTDEVLAIGSKNYVKSTATLTNSSNEQFSSVAYAQEGEHKGMSAPQYTGTASSYARKYAICSLLAIDDNVDVDSLDNRKENLTYTEENYKPSKPKGKTKLSVEECCAICNDCQETAIESGKYDEKEIEAFFWGKKKWIESKAGFDGDFKAFLRNKFKEKFVS